MSLILCRKEPVKQPFYIEELGVLLSSSQELCYVIYHHPLLVMDGFVDDSLILFIKEELDMSTLALKLERLRQNEESKDELLFLILMECNYYTSLEVSQYKNQLLSFRKMHPVEFMKAKLDYLCFRKQFIKAISGYEGLLKATKTQYLSNNFYARVLNSLGIAYSRMFWFDKALASFQDSYQLHQSDDTLRMIYFILNMDGDLQVSERFQSFMTEEKKQHWDEEIRAINQEVNDQEALKELDHLFSRDPIKRMNLATKLVYDWKQEYRG